MASTNEGILVPGTRELRPELRALAPPFPVAVGELNLDHPPGTPVIWTRGLRSDGTWGSDSPYRGEGGYVGLLWGEVRFFGTLRDQGRALRHFDGTGRTADLLEALSPGTRIGEYLPTVSEPFAWRWTRFWL